MTEQPTFKKVFVFLDTDKYCSPFDMLVAIDTFPDSHDIQARERGGDSAVGSAFKIGRDDDCP